MNTLRAEQSTVDKKIPWAPGINHSASKRSTVAVFHSVTMCVCVCVCACGGGGVAVVWWRCVL